MRNRIITMLLACLGLLSSCTEDEDSEFGELPEKFVGSWSSVQMSAQNCADDGDNGLCSVGCLTIAFTSDGEYTGYFFNSLIYGTVTASDSKLKLCDPTGTCNEVSYSEDGDMIEISWKDSEDGCTYKGTITQTGFPNDLTGTWTSDDASATGCDDSSDNGSCANDCLTYTFDADGSFYGVFLQETPRSGFGYTEGGKLYLCWSEDFDCQEITYSVSGNSGTASWIDIVDGCAYTATIDKQ